MRGKGTGNKKHKWQAQNRQGEVKNRIGNGEAKKLVCTTHGHELSGRNAGGSGGTGQRGAKGKQDNCNSIINKMYLIKKQEKGKNVPIVPVSSENTREQEEAKSECPPILKFCLNLTLHLSKDAFGSLSQTLQLITHSLMLQFSFVVGMVSICGLNLLPENHV